MSRTTRSEYTDLAQIIQGMWRYRHDDGVRGAMARNAIKWAIKRYRELDQEWRDHVLGEDPRDSI